METPKLILMAGADMVGKTEIAHELTKHLDNNYFKLNLEKDRNKDFLNMLFYSYETQVQMLEKIKPLKLVFDRGHLCEYAYSKVYGRHTSMSKIMEVDERLANLGAVIIYCYKQPEFYQEDPEDPVQVNQYDEIKGYYEEFLSLTKCKVVKLDTSDEDLDKQINTILEAI